MCIFFAPYFPYLTNKQFELAGRLKTRNSSQKVIVCLDAIINKINKNLELKFASVTLTSWLEF